jgi:hypothetical protein
MRCYRPFGALNYAIPATADWVVLRYVCVYVYPFSFFRVEFSFLNKFKKKKKVKNKTCWSSSSFWPIIDDDKIYICKAERDLEQKRRHQHLVIYKMGGISCAKIVIDK